jgi:hypothetical protein
MTGWFKPKEEKPEKTVFYVKNMWEDGPPKLVEGLGLEDADHPWEGDWKK